MIRTCAFAFTLTSIFATGCSSLLGIGEPSATDLDGSVPGIDADTTDAQTETLLTVTLRGGGVGSVTSEPPGINCPGDCDEVFDIGQSVTLTADTVAVFGGFRGAGTGCALTLDDIHCTFTITAETTSVSAGFFGLINVMFVTSKMQAAGSFDGFGNIDKLCVDSAREAGLPDGSYRAWLPAGATSAPSRLMGKSGWTRPDGKDFTFGINSLTNGQIMNPPMLDEFGQPVPGDEPVVTETLPDGTASTMANNNHCENYSSEGASGGLLTGETTGTTGRWTQGGASVSCATPAHFYCFETDFISAIPVGFPELSVAWVTQGTITPGGGFAAAQALCQSEKANFPVEWPGFGSVRALVTENGMPVDRYFDDWSNIDVALQRPDGVRVADDLDAWLAGGPSLTPVNVTVDSQYLDVSVWTGGHSFDTFDFDCTGWNNASDSMNGARRAAASIFTGGPVQSAPCNSALHVWCVAFNGAMAFLP